MMIIMIMTIRYQDLPPVNQHPLLIRSGIAKVKKMSRTVLISASCVMGHLTAGLMVAAMKTISIASLI